MREKALRTDLIRIKLAEIEESINLVNGHLPESFEEFAGLGIIKDGIYKRVEFAIETIFDICAILNSDLRFDIPESDEGIREGLIREGILARGMDDKLRRMRGFRNIVVHRYGRIDDSITYKILRNNLDDFYSFIDSVDRFLEGYEKKR